MKTQIENTVSQPQDAAAPTVAIEIPAAIAHLAHDLAKAAGIGDPNASVAEAAASLIGRDLQDIAEQTMESAAHDPAGFMQTVTDRFAFSGPDDRAETLQAMLEVIERHRRQPAA